MTAFFMMYLINNEYTAKGEQPIQGILCLDDKDAAAKLHYLAREWQYFPGKLLTPEMLKKDPGYYSCYISIGERNEMELGNEEASTYGCGTYRMFLILPEEEKIWAISMEEVFSAYRIYINGELAGEVGDPDEKTYMDRVMNRVFTFQGSGVVEIVIAVADNREDCGYSEAAVPLRSVSVSCLGLLWYMSEPGQKNLLFLIWSVSVWQDIRYAPWYIIFFFFPQGPGMPWKL